MPAHLLQPSISPQGTFSVYSPRATFMTAFFGGPFAAVLIHALNMKRLGRWRVQAPALAAALVVALLFSVYQAVAMARPHLLPFGDAVPANSANGTLRILARVVALVVWGALYLRFRTLYRASQLAAEHPPGFKAGLACALIGGGIQALVMFLTYLVVT